MADECPVKFDHPANERVLAYLKGRNLYKKAKESRSPSEVNTWRLHTHPELVDYFWSFGKEGQSWAAHSFPVLAHPATGIIYGFAVGTHVIVLRLPDQEREKAFAMEGHGRVLDDQAEVLGAEWAFVPAYEKIAASFIQAAYQYAAQDDAAQDERAGTPEADPPSTEIAGQDG
jgi:hypothetical protein